MVAAAAQEFEDTEQMIKTTEALYGPYRWGRYDLLVLPPSFPFGGMENPRVTFATPTVIVGDKSLVALVAHELAHSWSGNLVTNATWSDFWLNEGFTTYLERRIVEVVYGKKAGGHGAHHRPARSRAGARRCHGRREIARFSRIWRDRDPDDAYSVVPYEQGALFLSFLEAKFGREAFDRFLRRWFDEHAFQSVTTEQFLAFLTKHLLSTNPGAVTDAQIQEWLHTESHPLVCGHAEVRRARESGAGARRMAREADRSRCSRRPRRRGPRRSGCTSSTRCRGSWMRNV